MGDGIPNSDLYWLHDAAEKGNLKEINEFLTSLATSEFEERRRHLTSANMNGELPLHCAARGGHNAILALLLPEDLQNVLTDAQSESISRWSCMHYAAAYGHASTVQWLFAARNANVNVQDKVRNTPLHYAVAFGHHHVVRHLVAIGASLFILNETSNMPFSLCSDAVMFEALFSTYVGPAAASYNRLNTASPAVAVDDTQPFQDGKGRTILHYAAQFATDSTALAKLIAEMMRPDQLDHRDNKEDSFLHVAAKSGNMHILQALKKVQRAGFPHIDVPDLMNKSSCDPQYSPALYALLQNHRDFFDELITMSKVEMTLRCIIKALLAQLIDDPKIQPRLHLFASTLPTYLALYAKKDCIFNFLLETNVNLSLSQRDEEYKRTCLHWAVIHKRADIVQKLCQNVQLRPEIQDKHGKTALQHAVELNDRNLVKTIVNARPDVMDYEEKLYKDRDVYGQALNAILVGAALIASVTFAGWLEWPSTLNFNSRGTKFFWASNSVSFFTAVSTMCVTIAALLPTPNRYVGVIVKQLRLAIVIDAALLAVSLGAVTCAFATVGFAALLQNSHIFIYQTIIRATTAGGGFLCLITWLAFVSQVCKGAPSSSDVLDLTLPHWFNRWLRHRGSIELDYLSLSRRNLLDCMDTDLVASKYQTASAKLDSTTRKLETLFRISKMLNIPESDRQVFMEGIVTDSAKFQ